MGNILDPRVDSNNAGSGTGGGPATANASVSGAGPTGAPEGQASSSGPTSATANTTTDNTGIKGALNRMTGEQFSSINELDVGNNVNRWSSIGGQPSDVIPSHDVYHQLHWSKSKPVVIQN